MQLQNGYGVSEATNQHHINIQPHQPQFELFSHHHQPHSFDHSTSFSFRSPTDSTGVLLGNATFPANVPPPPSLLLPPQTLWKPGSENQLSHSPGSTGEVHEEQFAPNPKIQLTRRTSANVKKKEEEDKTCTEEDDGIEGELKALSGFIEARFAAHQERLHRRFTAAIDRMERDRNAREEAWRAAGAEAYRAHAEARARDLALASSREAVIVSYIEKMTGEDFGLVTGLGIGFKRPGQEARLEDDVTPPNSFIYSDVEGDVEYCEEMKRNEMLEALLEFKERTHILT